VCFFFSAAFSCVVKVGSPSLELSHLFFSNHYSSLGSKVEFFRGTEVGNINPRRCKAVLGFCRSLSNQTPVGFSRFSSHGSTAWVTFDLAWWGWISGSCFSWIWGLCVNSCATSLPHVASKMDPKIFLRKELRVSQFCRETFMKYLKQDVNALLMLQKVLYKNSAYPSSPQIFGLKTTMKCRC